MRKSSDQRSVDSSPRLIAAAYVLHRLLVPRHPPCALNNLTTQTPTPTHHHQPTPPKEARTTARWIGADIQIQLGNTKILLDARVHCAVLNVRKMTAHPIPPDPDQPPQDPDERYDTRTISQTISQKKHPTPQGAA